MKILIADDEPLALQRLEHYLKAIPDTDIVATCQNGHEALRDVEKHQPDLALLDIKMPGPDGFEIAGKIAALENPPYVIFVTAFDHFAVRAFEAQALDYLLKPVEKNRLEEAIELARTRIAAQEASERGDELRAIIRDLRRALGEAMHEEATNIIWVKDRGAMQRINTADIEWIEAERDYVRVHLDGKSHLMRNTMSGIANMLDQNQFIRVHRSAIVNTRTIRQMRLSPTGAHILRLASDTEVPVGRSYKKAVAATLKTC